ncbi:MAG: nucleotidyltransferase domain-containing protein [Chloroflexi bacterium]|nr:MAG: nucleotidyltransferase domain-containing protein [Chloroflexota bacterium]
MHPHHTQTIQNVKEYFERDPEVLALLLSGSIAHGFESPTSDVDIMIFLSEENHQKRFQTGQLTFFTTELCSYEGGYIDGKYISLDFVKQVAEKGSEPARFAFEGSQVLFNKIEGFEQEIRRVAEYPIAEKAERIKRFRAQLEAWHWYCGEALKRENQYLLATAVNKLILFGGRLILAHNEMLYPYHKWFLQVLERAKEKPADFMACLQKLSAEHTPENIEAFYEKVKTFQAWKENPYGWGAQFMLDSELNWMDGKTPVDDL